MTVRTEARIVRVLLAGSIDDLGAAVARSMPSHARYRYKQPVNFILEDGTKIATNITGLTKPKLAQRIEREDRYAKEGSLFASFYDGAYWGTIMKFTIGASR